MVRPLAEAKMSDLEAQFAEFHAENPEVYRLFDRFTYDVIKRGLTHYSADAIMHRVRWFTTVETSDVEGYKINNNWVAFYSRLWMRDHPEHEGFFETRVQKAVANGEDPTPELEPDPPRPAYQLDLL
jgi:hypothetical protein